LILTTRIHPDYPVFPSLSAEMPSLNWQEREIQDWFGIQLEGHPNPRRVALHDNWPDVHPLRKDFPVDCVLPPFEGERHVYRPAMGEGVLFEGASVHRAVFLAESISGDSSFSHGTAFCQAVERAAEVGIPPLAARMRTILLELERVYNHVSDIGAIATDVGFVIANAHGSRLREMMVNLNEQLTGNRLLRGMVCIGGVRRKWTGSQVSVLKETIQKFEGEFQRLVDLILASDSTRDRLQRTGILHPDKARDLGVVGVAGRASGIDLDVRRDHPYAAYTQYDMQTTVYQEGDVCHRVHVRIDQVRASLKVLLDAAQNDFSGEPFIPVRHVAPGRCALGAVEGWRGEILHWIRIGEDGFLERCKIKDPSLNNWPAVVEAVQGNIIPDFPVINKSFNLSYSGTDR
jgi:Ni,Fe-hydrogenase III large subunit